MRFLYPINSHPWNTFAVNAGHIDLLSGVITGIGSTDASLPVLVSLEASVGGEGMIVGDLFITKNFIATVLGTGNTGANLTRFYYGGLPIIISDWNTVITPSPSMLQTINWDQI